MADDIRRCGDLDERLAAYVDGEDTQDARQKVASHLDGCPPCRDAARDEAAARDLVRDHRGELAGHAPESLRARCARLATPNAQRPIPNSQRPIPSALRRWIPLSVAATLVLAVAGVFLFGLNDRVEALASSLAVDHTKCFKVYGTAAGADALSSERSWEHDQGWAIVVPQTEPAQQLKLVDVRRCFTTEGRSAHMMYTWRGEPLSVYVLQGDDGRDRVFHNKLGMQAIVWCANQRTYAMVASDASRDLTPMVDYMKARVR